MNEKLPELLQGSAPFTILLSHRPELFDAYVQHGLGLALTGHAHGGQVRLPWLGGLYLPGEGFFPELDAGMFAQNGTTMIISRGIGNSVIPRLWWTRYFQLCRQRPFARNLHIRLTSLQRNKWS